MAWTCPFEPFVFIDFLPGRRLYINKHPIGCFYRSTTSAMTNTKNEKTRGDCTTRPGSDRCQIKNPEPLLITAGGKIKCRRCVGISSRTKKQCRHPALKTSKASRCKWHAGASTGPKTEEGIARIREAHLKDGSETKNAKEERRMKLGELRQAFNKLNFLCMP